MNFADFAAAHGLIIKSMPLGKITRCPTNDKPQSHNGAFLYGGDWGWVMDWANGGQIQYYGSKVDFTDAEKREWAANKRAIENRAKKAQANAADKAIWIMDQCELSEFAYMDAHGMGADKVMVWRRDDHPPLMIVPMYHAGKVCGCQIIGIDGSKKFLSGQRCKEAEFAIGGGNLNFWCEGYCTGMAIQKAASALKIDYRIHICFSANNMLAMANSGFVIADNDASGVGEAVAKETGLPYFMPDTIGHDFCDMYQEKGLFATSQILRIFINANKKRDG